MRINYAGIREASTSSMYVTLFYLVNIIAVATIEWLMTASITILGHAQLQFPEGHFRKVLGNINLW